MTSYIKKAMDKKASKKAKARGEEHLYEYLGLPEDASQEDIKKAYRKLALRHHPDRGTGDDLVFKQINNANSVLSDEHKRKIYDVYGVKGLEMAEQFGEDAFVKYILGDSRYCVLFRVLFDVSFHKAFKPPEEEKKKVSFGERVKAKLNIKRKLRGKDVNEAGKGKITIPRSHSNSDLTRRHKAIEPRRNSFS